MAEPSALGIVRGCCIGCCAICGQRESEAPGKKLHIDHNHDTGAVRELLCKNCNALIGHAKEDVSTLQASVAYLGRHKWPK